MIVTNFAGLSGTVVVLVESEGNRQHVLHIHAQAHSMGLVRPHPLRFPDGLLHGFTDYKVGVNFSKKTCAPTREPKSGFDVESCNSQESAVWKYHNDLLRLGKIVLTTFSPRQLLKFCVNRK